LSGSILAIAIGSYFLIPDFQQFINKTYNILTSGDESRITTYTKSFGVWGPLLIILMMVLQMFLIIVPSWFLMIVAVLAYGPIWGALLSIVAVFTASTVGYVVGKLFSQATIYKLLGEKTEQKMERYIDRYGFGAVVIFRVAPFLSNDAISMVGGILRMDYWKFIGATLLGITPLAVLTGYFGQNISTLKTGLIWIGSISLVLYSIYIINDQLNEK